jgi:hypothetical protein
MKQNPLDTSSDLCYKCKTGGFLILCDGCMNACHCECDDPPMDAIPDGVWYCCDCRLSNSNKSVRGKIKKKKLDRPPIVQAILKNYVPYIERNDPVYRIITRDYWSALLDTKESYDTFKKNLEKPPLPARRSQKQKDKTKVALAKDLDIINSGELPEHYLSGTSEEETESEKEGERKKKRARRHSVVSNSEDEPMTEQVQIEEPVVVAKVVEEEQPMVEVSHPAAEDELMENSQQSAQEAVSIVEDAPMVEKPTPKVRILIRYRYNNETDEQMRLVKYETSHHNSSHVAYDQIQDLLLNDHVDAKSIKEIRYLDVEEGGWLLLDNQTLFPVEKKHRGDEGNEEKNTIVELRVHVTLIIYTNKNVNRKR